MKFILIAFFTLMPQSNILKECFFYLTRGLVNNINISNMAAIILLQIKK